LFRRGEGGRVSEKMFSREHYEQLRTFPEISMDELFRYFTLTPADAAFVDPGAERGPGDRLGMAVPLATLPWLGFVPDDVASAPPAVARLAERLGLDPGALREYGRRAQTRSGLGEESCSRPPAAGIRGERLGCVRAEVSDVWWKW
jgi:hypothetical protein